MYLKDSFYQSFVSVRRYTFNLKFKFIVLDGWVDGAWPRRQGRALSTWRRRKSLGVTVVTVQCHRLTLTFELLLLILQPSSPNMLYILTNWLEKWHLHCLFSRGRFISISFFKFCWKKKKKLVMPFQFGTCFLSVQELYKKHPHRDLIC